MLWKKSLQDRSSAISLSVTDPVTVLAGPEAPTLGLMARPQVAVFITHGMGQHVSFETLDAAAEGLVSAAARQGKPVSAIRTSTVQIAGIKTQRAEFDMQDANGKDVEIHVYEGYWAPFTEGQVNLRDVMSFLLRGGINGLRNCGYPFQRWIFGRIVSYGRRVRAALGLLAALGVVVSLIVLNLLIAVVGGNRLLNTILERNSEATFSETTFAALTSVTGFFVLSCVIFGGLLFILCWTRWCGRPSQNTTWRVITWFVQFLFWVWVLLTIATAAVLLLLVARCIQPGLFTYTMFSDFWFLIWSGLLVASWAVHPIMIQYPGDVAAYVSTHTLDRFADIRARIKTTVFNLAKAIYLTPQYERIAMIGHSLGSVVIYDTLNALINDDKINGGPLNVVGRTKLLLTFGSPLDKTAFIFASQWANTTATREALAASLQPLILKYCPFRDIKWINVYSPRDIVSGSLEFYDDQQNPESASRTVINVQDPDAMIPLVAHVEYWRNTTLFDQLYANI